MQYMGGKYRQAPKIVETLRRYVDGSTVYVEPFCGALGAGSKVVKDLRPAEARFNDLSRELVLLLERCYLEGCEWLPEFVDEDTYRWYRKNKPEGDPLTAFIGFGWSFRASWFHGYKRPYHMTSRDGNPKRGMERKVRYLREGGSEVRFSSADYRDMEIPDGAVVYCDPPYDGRSKVGDTRARFGDFDTEGFWQWARDLSLRCTVVTSCFKCPEDFCTVYSWGKNTIANSQPRGRRDAQRMDGYEKLVMWEGAVTALHRCKCYRKGDDGEED